MRASSSMVPLAAAALGALAFTADYLDGLSGQIAVALTSSGFAWGLAALGIGLATPTSPAAVASAGDAAPPGRCGALSSDGPDMTAPGRRSPGWPALAAVRASTSVLVGATLVYYLLVLVVSRRWSGGYLADGSSADAYGLRSVAVMTGVWLAGSLVAGPVLGLLGHAVRGERRIAAVAAGLACGLLSGQAWQSLLVMGSWRALPTGEWAVVQAVVIVLSLAVLTWLAARHRLWRSAPALALAFVSGAALSGLGWQMLMGIAR